MFTKYATSEILEIKETDTKQEGVKLASFDHLPPETYRTNDGYMYIKTRAISSRVNKNFDGWPAKELAGLVDITHDEWNKVAKSFVGQPVYAHEMDSKYGFKTFVGRPHYVDHNNTDPRRARGVVVDAVLHVEDPGNKYSSNDYYSDAPEHHKPETWVELLIELDAKSFPKLAKAFRSGKISAVSMGCNVEETECSICHNRASNADEFCDHVKKKGIYHKDASTGEKKLAYEDCYGINFFEISAVFDPADETALFTEPVIAKVAKPGRDQVTAPDRIDTLRDEKKCKFKIDNCGLDESGICDVCGYEEPPEGFNTPDLSEASKLDKMREEETEGEKQDISEKIRKLRKQRDEQTSLNNTKTREGNMQSPMQNATDKVRIASPISLEESPSDERLVEAGWIIDVDSAKTAASKTPAAEDGKKSSDEPSEQRVVEDQLAPVEAACDDDGSDKGDWKDDSEDDDDKKDDDKKSDEKESKADVEQDKIDREAADRTLVALELAEHEIALGNLAQESKYARVAELTNQHDLHTLQLLRDQLSSVTTAAHERKRVARRDEDTLRIPSMRQATRSTSPYRDENRVVDEQVLL